jgi:hypothetical protein
MLKHLDNKKKAYGTLIVFAILALAFWYFSDTFSLWASQTNTWVVMLVSIILNPAYFVLIYWLFKEYGVRGIFSGILISLGIDIISLTHSISKIGILPTGTESLPLYGYSDTLFYKAISQFLGAHPFVVFILYVVIPVLLVYLALRVIRRTSSFNRIVKEAM